MCVTGQVQQVVPLTLKSNRARAFHQIKQAILQLDFFLKIDRKMLKWQEGTFLRSTGDITPFKNFQETYVNFLISLYGY